MGKLIRTDKPICIKNIDENFIRKASSIGGKHSCPLTAEFDRFTVEDRFIGEFKTGGGSVHPWSDEHSEKYNKVQNSIEITLKGFDTRVVIWQNTNIQGYYIGSNNDQYNGSPIEWIQLLIDYGFVVYEL